MLIEKNRKKVVKMLTDYWLSAIITLLNEFV